MNFFPGNPLARAWQGSDAGQARPGGYAGQECGALLGEPVLVGNRTHWASPYSLGEPVLEPSNEVGASHQTRLGEPVLRGPLGEPLNFHSLHACFKACLARCLECLLGTSSACSARLVPARHRGACACSARLVKCLLGTASACSARSVPTYKCPLGTSTYKCPLGTFT